MAGRGDGRKATLGGRRVNISISLLGAARTRRRWAYPRRFAITRGISGMARSTHERPRAIEQRGQAAAALAAARMASPAAHSLRALQMALFSGSSLNLSLRAHCASDYLRYHPYLLPERRVLGVTGIARRLISADGAGPACGL